MKNNKHCCLSYLRQVVCFGNDTEIDAGNRIVHNKPKIYGIDLRDEKWVENWKVANWLLVELKKKEESAVEG